MAQDKSKKGTEVDVDGIKLTVFVDPSDDYELATLSMVIYDKDSDASTKSRAVVRRNMLLLGDRYQDVLDALREQSGGELRIETVNRFVSNVIKAVEDAKN